MSKLNKKNDWFLVINCPFNSLQPKVYFVKQQKNSKDFIDGAALVYYTKNITTTRNILRVSSSPIIYNSTIKANHIGFDYNKKYWIYPITKTDSVALDNTMYLLDKCANKISLKARAGMFNSSYLSFSNLDKLQKIIDIKLTSYYPILNNIINKTTNGQYAI